MLSNNNRLKSKSAYIATYKNQIVIRGLNIILYVGKSKDDKTCPTRVGFVVSKKVSKRAVKRNRMKRLMSEVIRKKINDDNFVLHNVISAVFSSINDFSDRDYNYVNEEISIILNKLATKYI